MPNIRIDNLPMDRQTAGQSRTAPGQSSLMGASKLTAVYEKRDIDPEAGFLKRRYGSQRLTNAAPNLLGVTTNIDLGQVRIDNTITHTNWTTYGTFRAPVNYEDAKFPLLNFQGVHFYLAYTYATNVVALEAYSPVGALLSTIPVGDIDLTGTDYRFSIRRKNSDGKIYAVCWAVPAEGGTATIGTETSFTPSFSGSEIGLMGPMLTAGAFASAVSNYDQVVLTNLMVFTVSDFSTTEAEALAADITPPLSGTNAGGTGYLLLWHEAFTVGGDVLSFTNVADATSYSYLVPTSPATVSGDSEWIHFGGQGVIEIPFYLDFDEYFWTPITASARLDWTFQLEVTLPAILQDAVVFEFQDILKLEITDLDIADKGFKGTFSGTGTVSSTVALAGGGRYEIFIGRSSSASSIKIINVDTGATVTTAGTVDNPAVFNYDKTLGFIIGDTVDQENSAPFGGQLRRFALHNENQLKWLPLSEAVLSYDINSLYGDEILDRGNRVMNAYVGTRLASSPPYYKEGGFKGGSYVAAVGGYTMAVSTPDIGYEGELKKAIAKDAVVQRRGSKSFLTTNGVNYLIDDFSKTFRPLGIPRPATKVSSTPQGVGVIDGFVRYAYRWVTKDGTVGPAFSLDPVDARNGVNVFLGADGFGLPGETPFGISYGESEGFDDGTSRGYTTSDSVECFVAKDTDGASDHNLLRREISFPGLTLETAFRIPELDVIKESIFSQGMYAPAGVGNWMADQEPFGFPWIGKANQECCFQFAFRYDSGAARQVLFGIGARNQHYETGIFNNDHYRLNHLVVSIQPPLVGANGHSLVVCRDAPSGSEHRDNDLHHTAFDYSFQDGHDYCVYVRRCGSLYGSGDGEDLKVHIFNNTLDGTDDGRGGLYDGWALWPTDDIVEKTKPDFWGPTYSGDARDCVMWGACRHEGSAHNVKTRYRDASGSAAFSFNYVPAMRGGTVAGTPDTPGSVMFHGRMWIKDFPIQVLAILSLDRYGARSGPLLDQIKVDLAFCSDSSRLTNTGGWCFPNDMRVKFHKQGGGSINGKVLLTENVDNTPILGYGYDMTVNTATTPDTWTTDSLDNVPMWINWSSRNEGSLSIGVGKVPEVEIAERKWHVGSAVKTFDELAGIIDLKQWTWVTLYYHHIDRPASSNSYFDVWLNRVFLDGNWIKDVLNADLSLTGLQPNPATGSALFNRGLFTVGGIPGMNQKYTVDIAETRLWDGNYYTAEGVPTDPGDNAFGPLMSNRVPPNVWDKLWYYLRYMKIDVDDVASQTTMDQFGLKKDPDGFQQHGSDAVKLYQQSIVKDGTEDAGESYFIPFPQPPMTAIRGIQIFRTQVIPVSETYPNGQTNPNAVPEAWKACRDAPLYSLTEIPRGSSSYTDTAPDAALGALMDSQTGLIPREPKGVFEWEGHLGVFVADQPRIHFAESPLSWESFPLAMAYDLPVREYGPVEAAVELASRDARQSRVLCLGKSWGVFLDGSPANPQANTLGGGVGASSSRCLVVEKGIAYSYNGTLWGITGDGQVEDLSLPVQDLLPDPLTARLSVSSALNSLFVIDEVTGLALRFHLAKKQWFVEDRYALSVTDVNGVDTWVHVSGYPSEGVSSVYQDDVDSDTPETGIAVSSYVNGDNPTGTVTLASVTGLQVGQRGVLVADGSATATENNPQFKQAIVIQAINGSVITAEGGVALTASFTPLGAADGAPELPLTYKFYPGVGYWGTMLDTGQFNLSGDLNYVDVGVERGEGWWAQFDASDFAKDPADRSGFVSPESQPISIVDASGGGGSARWGLSNRQRLERVIIFSNKPTDGSGSGVGLTELELNYSSEEA